MPLTQNRKTIKKQNSPHSAKKRLSCLSINAFNPKQKDDKKAKLPLREEFCH
jgi:hypothetical protein